MNNVPHAGQGKEEGVQPDLAAPGAGIPWLEQKALGAGLRLLSRRMDREKMLARFGEEGELLLSLALPLDEAAGRRRVLVPRQPGMEDSSRFWSPYMILEHVMTVNRAIALLARALAAGKPFGREVRTADVKPSPGVGPEVTGLFRESMGSCRELLAGLEIRGREMRHVHPWFGPLDAHQWCCLMAVHEGIHRRQMQQVIARM